jgi:DNA-binding transcriptional ArsR family regulator
MSSGKPERGASPDGPPTPEELTLASVLEALSDPVRLEIVRQIAAADADGCLTCGQLDVPVTKSTGSHHLKVLRCAGVTTERSEGTRKYLTLRNDDLEERFPGLLGSVLRAVNSRPSA